MQREGNQLSRGVMRAVLLASAAVLVLLLLFYLIVQNANRNKAYQTSELLIDRVGIIIDNNDDRTQALVDSLKEDYITRAKSIAYLLERQPEMGNDIDALSEITEVMLVDEIHLFDTTGTIVSGTVPRYYGYSFDSGEQIGFFKPMLSDKTLSLCQDVTPNTAEGKSMMYALCWNRSGTAMVQVGIEPVRLLNELHAVAIPEVLANIASYEGTKTIVADADSGLVEGSTGVRQAGEHLSDMGIDLEGRNLEEATRFTATIDGERCYCAAQLHGAYVIVVAQSVRVANEGMATTMGVAFLYLVLTAVAISYIVRRMTAAIIEEHRNANVDQMTDLLNRRAYESALQELRGAPLPSDLVYVSMDLNGLKQANDTLGHEAGDKLISCASRCMKQTLGEHGNVYRIGGDEFAALITAKDDPELQLMLRAFRIMMEDVSREEGIELSVSTGPVMASEHPEMSIDELAKAADQRMYESKRRYYEMSGHDRRARRR